MTSPRLPPTSTSSYLGGDGWRVYAPLAQLGRARAYALPGDRDNSRKAYDDFFTLASSQSRIQETRRNNRICCSFSVKGKAIAPFLFDTRASWNRPYQALHSV